MSVVFFGQFLIERGEIDAVQLREALDLMEQENRTLGELAAAAGYATAADARRVNGEQRRLDLPFGEIALRMGVLNSVELEDLLLVQHETRLHLHDAIARALTGAGADLTLRGTGDAGFFDKTAADLALENGQTALGECLRHAETDHP